jgi:aerobic-type carbon monoxide dehydrogenase small subunit (CoxS/CutS family)
MQKEVPMISLKINGRDFKLDVAPETPLLWVIREHLQLTGTKFGCGVGECGSGGPGENHHHYRGSS